MLYKVFWSGVVRINGNVETKRLNFETNNTQDADERVEALITKLEEQGAEFLSTSYHMESFVEEALLC